MEASSNVDAVVLDASIITAVDIQGMRTLLEIGSQLKARKVALYIAQVRHSVYKPLEKNGFIAKLGPCVLTQLGWLSFRCCHPALPAEMFTSLRTCRTPWHMPWKPREETQTFYRLHLPLDRPALFYHLLAATDRRVRPHPQQRPSRRLVTQRAPTRHRLRLFVGLIPRHCVRTTF
jgi:hypothetical protein